MIQSKTKPAPADLLPGVIAAVTEAGCLLRAEFHRVGGPRGAGSKAEVDREMEDLLKARLQTLHACRWHAEETPGDAIDARDVWVVDPNDGTRDFLNGLRGTAISIALLRDFVPVLGVVFAPVAPDDDGDLIAWAEGSDLTRNGAVTPGFSARKTGSGQKVLALNADAADYAAVNHGHLQGLRVRAVPSPAYRLALAAAGEVDLGASLIGALDAWDIAGGHAVLIGAGGVMLQRHGGAVDYRRACFDGVIGGAKAHVRAVLPLLARLPTSDRPQPRVPARPLHPEPDAALLSRAQGCLLGLLAGDALGSAVEFRSAADIARSYPLGVNRLADGGTWNLIAGQPTDDGEMALSLARSLVAKQGFDAAAVGAAYVAWHASGPFDIGATTSQGITALRDGRAARSDSQANGALMRVAPIGIHAAGDPALAARLAAEDARLTHPDPVCQAASAAFAAAIAVAVAGEPPEAIWTAAHDHAGDGPGAQAVRARLVAARHAAPKDFQHQMGWVLTAFHNAVFRLMSEVPLHEALTATVGCGGDTDTNAAICGALLGAAQGRNAIPLQWRNAVLTCRPVPAKDITHPRPATWWPDDALSLAEALLAIGPSSYQRHQRDDFDPALIFPPAGKYLGNISLVEQLVRDFFVEAVAKRYTEDDSGGDTDKTDWLHHRVQQAARIVLGQNPDYAPLRGWNSPTGGVIKNIQRAYGMQDGAPEIVAAIPFMMTLLALYEAEKAQAEGRDGDMIIETAINLSVATLLGLDASRYDQASKSVRAANQAPS